MPNRLAFCDNRPATRISPVLEIDALWFGKRKLFENGDEAQAFYDVMICLWNSLAENRATGKPVAFSPRTGLSTVTSLRNAMEARHSEISNGFFSGFIGNMRRSDEVTSGIDGNICKLSDVIDEIEELIERPSAPAT